MQESAKTYARVHGGILRLVGLALDRTCAGQGAKNSARQRVHRRLILRKGAEMGDDVDHISARYSERGVCCLTT